MIKSPLNIQSIITTRAVCPNLKQILECFMLEPNQSETSQRHLNHVLKASPETLLGHLLLGRPKLVHYQIRGHCGHRALGVN